MSSDQSPGTLEELALTTQAATKPSHELQEGPIRSSELASKKKLWKFISFPVVLTFLVLTLVFTLGHGLVGDPDIWWHLHNAEHLIQHHGLPGFDTYSFTVPGHFWMNHEWLAELPYYAAWKILGLRGIDALSIATLSLIFLGVLYLSYQECKNYKAAVVATACAIFLGRGAFGPRTILFGYAYLVVLLIILQSIQRKGRAPLWLIPPLFCVWVNTHGSWFIGMIVFSIIAVGGLIGLKWGMIDSTCWTTSQRKKLLLTWGASLAALFVNPFGWRLVVYPLDLAFRQKVNIEHVEEWVSLNFHDVRGKFVIVLIIILLVSSLVRPRRWTWAELGVTLFALYSGLTYVRFLILLGIVLAPILAKTLDFVPPYRPELDTPVLNSVAIFLMIAGVAYYRPREAQLQNTVDAWYPHQAVSYLQAQSVTGSVVNYYIWGGYINWKDPNLKIFIDGRADIFEYGGVFEDYLSLLQLEEPERILDRYHAQYVLMPHHEPLTYVLEHDSKWKTVYSDRACVLFERERAKGEYPQGEQHSN